MIRPVVGNPEFYVESKFLSQVSFCSKLIKMEIASHVFKGIVLFIHLKSRFKVLNFLTH